MDEHSIQFCSHSTYVVHARERQTFILATFGIG